jgi:hypothetical protein
MHLALNWWLDTPYEATVDLMEYAIAERVVWGTIDVAREYICCLVGSSQCMGLDAPSWF